MEILSRDGTDVISENYVEFSKYVIATRAYPSIIDGCKAVHRRCIHCCYKYLPRHKVKSAEATGKITVLHPHPQSIYGVLVSMASKYDCKFPLFDTKGNFGGLGFPAAAERYTELMLSDLAIKIYEQFSDYVDMKSGEMNTDEPVALAAMLPLCFLHGSYGIPTGMSTVNIPALNPIDMVKYYIEVLNSRDLNKIPKILVRPNIGGVDILSKKDEWSSVLDTGCGSIKYAPRIEIDGRKITILSVPDGKDISNLMNILKDDINTDKIDVRDESTNEIRYVVELLPYKRVNINDVKDRIIRGLSVKESYRFIFADDGIATFCGFHTVVKRNLEYLIECCKRKLDRDIEDMRWRLDILEAISKLRENSDYIKSIVEMDSNDAIYYISEVCNITYEQAQSLLSKPMSYLTRSHEIEESELSIKLGKCIDNREDIYAYVTELYKSLLKDIKQFMKGHKESNFIK